MKVLCLPSVPLVSRRKIMYSNQGLEEAEIVLEREDQPWECWNKFRTLCGVCGMVIAFSYN
jgi:hypothetical protein